MAKFSYKSKDQNDRVLTGALDGATVDDIIDVLRDKNQIPIIIEELNFDGSKKNETFFEKLNNGIIRMQNKVPYKNVVFFTRQLATMIEAGVQLDVALNQLAESEPPVFKRIILKVAEDISMGSTFSDALAKHPSVFNNMFVSVVQSGEISGALDRVLDHMATYMENIETMKQKVRGAMRYPSFIAFFVTAIVIGILWKLVPVFEGLYASFNQALPKPTQILIFLSHLIQDNFIIVILLIIGLVILIKALLTNDSVKMFAHTYILKLPVFGLILQKNILAVYCRTLALLMESGTPILQAIEIGGAVVNNKYYAEKLERVYNKLRTGEMLSTAMKNVGGFPVLIIQLTATGEQSGKVDDLLRKAAEFYEREIRITVDSLASIIEPFLIVILGTIVGSILIALYFPIFTLGKLFT